MKLKSETDINQAVHEALDEENHALPPEVKHDLQNARLKALAQLRKPVETRQSWFDKIGFEFKSAFYWTTAPVAVAIAVVILLSYQSIDTLPVFPADMLTAQVPQEDLALLEDLEFADWLSQQQEVLN